MLFHIRKKLHQHKILVALFAVTGVDIKRGTSIVRGDQKIFELAFVAHVLQKIPCAGMDKELFVVPQTMKKIQDRESPCFISIKRRWKNDAVRDRTGQDFAVQRIAFNATGCQCRSRQKDEAK